MTSHN